MAWRTLVFALCWAALAIASTEAQVVSLNNLPAPEYGVTSLEDGQSVTNTSVLGPDQDLLPPYIATQVLQGEDYFEWCLRWNKLQYYQAEQRSESPRTLNGSRGSFQRYTEGFLPGRFSRGSRIRLSEYATSDTRQQQWQLGGHAGGAVTLYNPFVSPN